MNKSQHLIYHAEHDSIEFYPLSPSSIHGYLEEPNEYGYPWIWIDYDI